MRPYYPSTYLLQLIPSFIHSVTASDLKTITIPAPPPLPHHSHTLPPLPPTTKPTPTPTTTVSASKPTAAGACPTWTTATHYLGSACPQICIPADDPACPAQDCAVPRLTACAAGWALTTPAMTPASSTVSVETDAAACKKTAWVYRRCVICGCLGCPRCVKTAAPTAGYV